MKPFYLLAVVLLTLVGSVSAQTSEQLRNTKNNTDNVLTYGMGYNQNRYSTLDQINKSNIKKLVPTWSLSLENNFGEQAQPLVYDGVMYIANAKWTVAVDAISGKQIWRTPVDFDPDTPRVVCCGVSNKGVALYNGKVFRTTLDAYVIALDQKTGKQIWKEKASEWKEGYSQTAAPQIANGVVVTGISGAEFGIRGFIDGWDPETGKHLWRRHTTAGPGEPGANTWIPQETHVNGGASTWITGSYDPELDLMYWGTGNAGPWNPKIRRGDNLYAASIIAIRPKTGEIVWHYQPTPNDIYDWDAVWEIILAEVTINGAPRKVAMQMNRNGFLYVLDRATGELLSASAYSKVNWATHVDLKTGRPVESELAKKLRAGEQIEMWPSIRGAKNWPHAAFNPKTGLLYANTNWMYAKFKMTEIGEFKAGFRFVGTEVIYPPLEKDMVVGHVEAIDPVSGKAKWRVPLKNFQNTSAMLATAGGVLFTGQQNGDFVALDAENGDTLWHFKTPSGISAQPITWSKNGKQYVTVLSGLGGSASGRRGLENQPLGGSVWTFALFDQ